MKKYLVVLHIEIILLFIQIVNIFALINVKGELKLLSPILDQGHITDEIKNYKNEIETQQNDKLNNDVDFQLKELASLMSLVRDTQDQQEEELNDLSISLEITKDSLLKMLSEYENRIDQLEYTIMEIKKYDPYMEKFNYPISKYWLKIDFHNFKSLWKYQKKKHYTSIVQVIDMTNFKYPSTILLLRHHKLIEGYINVEVLQKSSSLQSNLNNSSSGIIFDFVDVHNFSFVELSILHNQVVISLGVIDDSRYSRIISKGVEADGKNFNALICEFVSNKMNIFLNYKKVIEVNFMNRNISDSSGENPNKSIGLFTKSGTAEFRNFFTGSLQFEKIMEHKLVIPDEKDISIATVTNSYRFSNKETKDDLSVYTIPYSNKDYDDYFEEEIINDVYPVPDSNSRYDNIYDNINVSEYAKRNNVDVSNELSFNSCKNYTSKDFNLNEWISNNKGSSNNWNVISQFGIKKMIFRNSYKFPLFNSALVYKNILCNSIIMSSYIKVENDTEAGFLFRYENKDNMFILTISTPNKEIILKKKKNNIETVIKSEYVKNINSIQRHQLLIQDSGEAGVIHVYLDTSKLFSIDQENYFKSGKIGFYVEHGYAAFDTLKVQQHV
ncbi:hypothetical protein, conserved [Plasmodium gonderi]|uniref:Uncharacterized protein n=1 Tax=Plasmodium gonderi TaxID=77519 RepID=A0A1Y1JTZ3_PLAGO|nr:hypothetical protein, conserved [Plasmodium gonderi]GAW83374.1 hypothetical protein, conserved [Plasmodium gonderi]